MLVEAIEFKNFKALRDTTLPLGPFTLLVGPNGSGKSTAIRSLAVLLDPQPFTFQRLVSASVDPAAVEVRVTFRWAPPNDFTSSVSWSRERQADPRHIDGAGRRIEDAVERLRAPLLQARWFQFDPGAIARAAPLDPEARLEASGGNLAVVLDQLRDRDPEAFDELNRDLHRCLPEFDRILFDTPEQGMRRFSLRTARGRRALSAPELSEGTLLALGVLTMARIAGPASFLAIEEPDRGVHPRLLRQLQDALYGLAYPQDGRAPVQVVVTTHSPYFLDLFRDHPEEVVLAHKEGLDARFERLSDRKDIDEILSGGQLGEIWYSGVLGGVPGR